MNDSAKDKLGAVALGALGGGVAGFIVWQVMKVQVDQQVTASVNAAVATQIQTQLAQIGLTPSVAANIRTLVTNLDNLGVLSALATSTTRHA